MKTLNKWKRSGYGYKHIDRLVKRNRKLRHIEREREG